MATTLRSAGADVPLRSQSVRTPRTRPEPLMRSESSSRAGESSSSRQQRHANQRITPVISPRAPPSSHDNAPPPPGSAKAAEPPNAGSAAAQTDPAAIRDYVDPKGNRFKVKMVQGQSGRRYFLYKTIGQGSMGKVKLAKMENSDVELACKVIIRPPPEEQKKDDQKKNEEAREERNVREAKIVSLLNHPYICGLRDHLKTKWHWYMFFEYVNGGQMLDYIISHGKLKEKQARKFARQIASAVDYCHRNSIVHRDLKIENILISKTGDIKIIDFGLSNLFSPYSLNKLRTFCGSLYFAAPELLQANPYTGPEVDVWSFGVVLFVLVCGKVPFDDQLMPALHAKIKKGVVDYPNWLSTECKHLISRMLVTDPSKRATMSEVMSHPWMLKNYNGPPDNYYPHREPLTLPLDLNILTEMRGFNFHDQEFPRNKDESQEDYVARVLPLKIQSPRYQTAVRRAEKDREPPQAPPKDAEKKQGFRFDFYKRRNSTTSRDTLTNISSEALSPGEDPYNAYDPMISMYYLIQEKWDRDRSALNPQTPASPLPSSPRSSQPAVQSPQVAVHAPKTMPLPSQPFPAHGAQQQPAQPAPTPAQQTLQLPQPPSPLVVKEKYSLADMNPPGTGEMRPRPQTRSRSHSVDQPRDLPPKANAGGGGGGGMLSPDSANPAKESLLRRLSTRRKANREPQSADGRFGGMRSASMRVPKSLGQARRESIEVRRVKREAEMRQVREEQQDQQDEEQYPTPPEQAHSAREQATQDGDDGGGDDGGDTRDQSGASNERIDSEDPDLVRPVLLKGIFSVSTTSTKPLGEIRSEIRRVLRVLGIDHTQTRGGFRCTRVPSIIDNRNNNDGVNINAGMNNNNNGGNYNGSFRDRDYDYSPVTAEGMPTGGSATTPRSAQPRQKGPVPGEITFEVVIVKVPILSIYGVQFKRVGGDTWQYKALADQIVKELRL